MSESEMTDISNDHTPPLPINSVKGFCDQLERHFTLICKTNDSAKTRLVWFVAISGYGLLNVRSFSQAVIGRDVIGYDLIILAVPWAVAGILGIVSHWVLGEFTASESHYHMWRLNKYYAFIAKIGDSASRDQVIKLLDETEGADPLEKKSRERLYPWAKGLEIATFLVLALSFLVTIIYSAIIL